MKEKAIFNWSGGKDSALCLYKVLQSNQYDIVGLLTSINKQNQKISMHGVNVDLLQQQADSIGLPLIKMEIPEIASMEIYESAMKEAMSSLKAQGVTVSIFGDIFLEDLRAYRENKLSEMGFRGVFPLWKIPTNQLITEFIKLGFKTITTCVNDKYLDKSFVGRVIDNDFVKELPQNVDPCGENGEFHTFVFEGSIFKKPIQFEKGEIIYKKYDADNNKHFENGFWYCDLIPK